MRPASIVHFQRILVAALAVDLVNNLLSWNVLASRLAAEGIDPHPLALLAMCLASPLAGLLFWYFIARRRSNIARWVMAAFVAAGAAGFAYKTAQASRPMDRMLVIGIAGALLKVIAVSRLFTADAGRWFRARPITI